MAKLEINFRQTSAYRTDDSADAFVMTSSNMAYPNVTSQGYTIGWTNTANISTGNRSLTVDARLAGSHYQAWSAATRQFRINLPSTGAYKVRLAMGYPAFTHYGKVDLYDNTTFVTNLADQSSQTGGTWADATNTQYSAANWVTSNTQYEHTFTSSDAYFHLANNGSSTGNRFLAHIEIVESASNPTLSSAGSASTNFLSSYKNTKTVTITGVASTSLSVTASVERTLSSVGVASTNFIGTTASPNPLLQSSGQATTNFLASYKNTKSLSISAGATTNFVATSRIESTLEISGQASTNFVSATSSTADINITGSSTVNFLAEAIISRDFNISGSAVTNFLKGLASPTWGIGGSATTAFISGATVSRNLNVIGQAQVSFEAILPALPEAFAVNYLPNTVPSNPEALPQFLLQEFQELARVLEVITKGHVEITYAEPTKLREGLVRLADGTHWNPGSGKGVYAYYGGSWNKLG